LILGDNFFYGPGLGENFFTGLSDTNVSCFGYQVADPSQYGIAELDEKGQILALREKPEQSKSNIAITGLYRFPSDVFDQVKFLKPSERGELEIIDLINQYFLQNRVQFRNLPRGTAWLDTGSPNGLLGASNFVQLLQDRQNLLIGSPHESAWRKGRISSVQLAKTVAKFELSTYGQRLEILINDQT
jgi:glucose-1-phosphate thymidylyltransferase